MVGRILHIDIACFMSCTYDQGIIQVQQEHFDQLIAFKDEEPQLVVSVKLLDDVTASKAEREAAEAYVHKADADYGFFREALPNQLR